MPLYVSLGRVPGEQSKVSSGVATGVAAEVGVAAGVGLGDGAGTKVTVSRTKSTYFQSLRSAFQPCS